MIYLSLGEAIRQGIPLYKGIHDNKPPLLYVMAAITGNLFLFKALLTFWMLITIYIFWKLVAVLFPKSAGTQKVATILFAVLTTIPLLEGNIINAELFMVGPTILAFYILLSKRITPTSLLTSGALFSLATLFKMPAAFDVPTIVFMWVVAIKKLEIRSLKLIIKNTLLLTIGFVTPILLTIVFYFFQGALKEYLVAAFLQNVGYLSSWRPSEAQQSFLVKNAPLLIRAGVVGLGLLILYWKRNKLSKEFIFATAWLLFSLFAVTLSERPYPHYLIQSVPAISILIGILATNQTKLQTLSIIPLTLAFFVPVYFKFWYYPTFPYYSRFIKLITGQMARNQYLDTFGSQVARNYKIAEFIQSTTIQTDKIFIWGDGSPIYALSRRFPPIKYVADYHIKDFSTSGEVASGLMEKLPLYIIVLPDSSPLPNEIKSILDKNYGVMKTIDGTTIWKVFGPKVRSLISP